MRVRAVLVAVLGALLLGVAVPRVAGADAVSDKRAEAARIAGRLEELNTRVEQLVEEYNLARQQLQELDREVKQTQEELAKNQAATESVRSRMHEWAVRSYVEGASADPVVSMLEPAQSMEAAAGLEGYTDAALGRDEDLSQELRQRGEDTARLQQRLNRQLENQQDLLASVDAKRKATQRAEDEARQELAQAERDLGELLVQEQLRRQREAEISAQEAARVVSRAAAEAEARPADDRDDAARPAPRGTPKVATPATPTAPQVVPPPSPGAAGAIAAARSQLGVPYRWGEMSPGEGFDCSGLTAWAWGQAGHSLPHQSRAQYAATRRVSVEDIQPGDLVFFGRPIHHVALYIGNGQMIDAPHSGAVVRIAPAFRRDLVGVGRV